MTSTTASEAVVSERTPKGPPSMVALVGHEPAIRGWATELVDRARQDGVELTGDNGLLTALVRQVLQTGLEVETTDHLGYEPHAVDRVPRDRNATLEPVTVRQGQPVLEKQMLASFAPAHQRRVRQDLAPCAAALSPTMTTGK